VVRILILFDLIRPVEERIGFRDLVTAREVARLMKENVPLADVVLSAVEIARRAGAPESHPLARHKLVCDRDGRLVVRAGGGLADLDGQLRLPLPDAGNPTVDSLFEEAEEAEEAGDLAAAEALYRRCVMLDRQDPIAPFNLANVLREMGRVEDARVFFQHALTLDPDFAEAWYNLAGLMEQAGQREIAREFLRRAVAADPYYGDPLYNLALWHFQVGEYAEAVVWWERYLDLDPDSEWSRKARQGLALCHQHLARSTG
jgi:tetratricopeptide (TPR) repeat protein